MPTYGQRPDDVVQDSKGNALSGVAVQLHATEGAASSDGSTPLETVTTDGRGRWRYEADEGELWARLPDGTHWEISGPDLGTKAELDAETAAREAAVAAEAVTRAAADDALTTAVGLKLSTATAAATYETQANVTAGLAGKVAKGELVLNVLDYGAVGDNVADDTAAIQSAITAATAGAVIYFPPGTYSVTNLLGTGKSTLALRGVRGKSVLQLRSGTGPVLGWNVTATPGSNDHHLTFEGLTFKGLTGLVQHTHLLSLSAVDDVLVTNCEFIQFPGDGIYLGRTQVGGSDTGVQNQRVKITNNLFDGVDYTNRNGVSIIAGDDVLIEGNTFRRCSHSTMPGAVDIEPNVLDVSTIVRDIRVIGNTFSAVGGNTGAVGLALPAATWTTQPTRILVSNNTFSGSKAADVFLLWAHTAVDGDAVTQTAVLGNLFGAADAAATARAVSIDGLRGVTVNGNTFNGGRVNGPVLGGATYAVREVTVSGNTIIDQGGTSQRLLAFKNAAKLTVADNVALFTTPTASHLVYMMSAGTSDSIVLRGNHCRGINYYITVDAGHTTTAAGNFSSGNTGAPLGSPTSFTATSLSATGPFTTTAPAAGGAGALPATPLGYYTVNLNGTDRKVAYY